MTREFLNNEYLNTLLIQHRQSELQEHLKHRQWLQEIRRQQPKQRSIPITFLNLIGFNL